MDKIKFYSEHDLASGFQLDQIVGKIKNNELNDIKTIKDFIEIRNIIKYLEVERFSKYIESHVSVDCLDVKRILQRLSGIFLAEISGDFLKLYEEVDFDDLEDFLEIIERNSLYTQISDEDFKNFLGKEKVHLYSVLKLKNLTEHFSSVIRGEIIQDARNAEIIIAKFLGEADLYLPSSLTKEEILVLINDYIDSPGFNINYLRSIVFFPTNSELKIPDKIRLNAKRKEQIENEKLLNNGTGIVSGYSISYPLEQEKAIITTINGLNVEDKVSRKWIEENQDFPTLWNNFIYIFDIVDGKFRLNLDSKTHGMSALEAALLPTGSHLYRKSQSFDLMEMIGNGRVFSYMQILNIYKIRIEKMIEWFFMEYLKEEFSIENFVVKMPSEVSPFHEKCRSILPEVERIFKQYKLLVEDGVIDQELVQLSSHSFKFGEAKSLNINKYVYPLDGWYSNASHLLFSDQSGIFYLPKTKGKYKNFIDLITNELVMLSDFNEYQKKSIQWLFDNNLIFENSKEYIAIADYSNVYILGELYNNDVISYWHCPFNIRTRIDDFEKKGYVGFESSLLSRNEQDYLDFYLNKSKFTNGYDIRNSYLHGTNGNDEGKSKTDYYLILKLIIIIVIKINDDLCLKFDSI